MNPGRNIVRITRSVINHCIIRRLRANTPCVRVDGLPPRVIPDDLVGSNPIPVSFQDDRALQIRIRPLLLQLTRDHEPHCSTTGERDGVFLHGTLSIYYKP